jgi:hypothetical protein
VYRVQRDVRIAVLEFRINDDQVVYVIQILTNNLGGDIIGDVMNSNIPRGAIGNLMSNMMRQNELAVIPSNFDLVCGQYQKHALAEDSNYPLFMNVDVISSGICEETLGSSAIHE